MNGRVYDPTIGRFLSADPHIQAPGNLQSYNRYSYVMNNPLRYTDPSGYFFKKLWRSAKKRFKSFQKAWHKHWRTAVSIGITVMMPGAGFMSGFGAVAKGAITGFVSGAVATGSLRGAVVGGLTGGALGSVHNTFDTLAKGAGLAGQEAIRFGTNSTLALKKLATHGLVGGLSSVANGGKFGHGFASMGLTQAASLGGLFDNGAIFGGDAGNYVGASLIGGAGSVIAGGKFGYGAVQGIWSHYLNDKATNLARANRARRAGFEAPYDSGVTLAGVSEGSGYMATMFLAGPGTQAASPFFGFISLVTGVADVLVGTFAGSPNVDISTGQVAADVVSNAAADAALGTLGNTPAGRVVGTGVQVVNHATDYLINANQSCETGMSCQ